MRLLGQQTLKKYIGWISLDRITWDTLINDNIPGFKLSCLQRSVTTIAQNVFFAPTHLTASEGIHRTPKQYSLCLLMTVSTWGALPAFNFKLMRNAVSLSVAMHLLRQQLKYRKLDEFRWIISHRILSAFTIYLDWNFITSRRSIAPTEQDCDLLSRLIRHEVHYLPLPVAAILSYDQRAVQLLEQPTDQLMWISRFLVLFLQRFTSPEKTAKRRFNLSNCLSMLLEGTLKATHAAWTKCHKHKLPGASMKGNVASSNAKEETERVLYLQYVYTQAYVYTSIYIYTSWTQPDQAKQRYKAALDEDEFDVEAGCCGSKDLSFLRFSGKH